MVSADAPHVACRQCQALVAFDPNRMRLRHTSAEVVCPRCSLVMRVRRGDTRRDVAGGTVWVLSSYAGQQEDSSPTERERAARWVHRQRR
jgi:hypothetical protein